MKRREWMMRAVALAVTTVAGRAADAAPAEMVVYKSPACGCCTDWVKHVRPSGFAVKVVEVADLVPVQQRFGVPERLAACHTALIGG